MVLCARSSSSSGVGVYLFCPLLTGGVGVVRGEGEGGGCCVLCIVVAACVLDRLVTGADVWSARVVPLGSADGPPMSVTGAGSVACAIVLIRWVRMLELHYVVDVSGRTAWGMCCMMASRMCVPHSASPGCCNALAWMVRQGPFVCVRNQLSSLGLQVACPWVPVELCSMIVHVTEFSSTSNQWWLSLSGMSVVVFEVTTLLRRVRCWLFVTSHIVMAFELSSAFIPAGSWGLMIMVMASSMAPEEMWLLPAKLWRALSGWESRSDCASLCLATVGILQRSAPVAIKAAFELWVVARCEGGMY
jgi:hypothetical protein